ncbi:hypothetical protein [Candidatus Parabeggiatoa sp. HSG14]|uniref:hypothetical protein n=1 Tax=Candidatus Parabeggiatoa sp. HSG14 TaxID=3055593 RepID=UPI0025A81A60|nr:hypothetical protein [Thiotrichales bacterium HSG14]
MWLVLELILLFFIVFWGLSLLKDRMNDIGSTIIKGGVIIGLTGVIIVVAAALIEWHGKNEKKNETTPSENKVISFLQEMNPELNKKVIKIGKEITLADKKIQQLQNLKKEFPNQSLMINQKINQWQTLQSQLQQVSDNIHQEVEKAYVTYKIAEIQGKEKFSIISIELLKEANLALANAELTKTTIEAQINE